MTERLEQDRFAPVMTPEQAEQLIAWAERGYQHYGVCTVYLYKGDCACAVGAMLRGMGRHAYHVQRWKVLQDFPNAFGLNYQEHSSTNAAKIVLKGAGVENPNVGIIARVEKYDHRASLAELLWYMHDTLGDLER